MKKSTTSAIGYVLATVGILMFIGALLAYFMEKSNSPSTKTPVWVWILLTLSIILLLVGFGMAFFARLQ